MKRFTATAALFVLAAPLLGAVEVPAQGKKDGLGREENIPALMTRIAAELGTSRETQAVGAAARPPGRPAKDKLESALADKLRQALPAVPPMPSLAPQSNPEGAPFMPWTIAGGALGAGLGASFAGRKKWIAPILLAGLGGAAASVAVDQALRLRHGVASAPLSSPRAAVR